MGGGPNLEKLSRWKIFDGGPIRFFFWCIIDPKEPLWCNLSKIEDGVFEKNPLFCIPYLGPKWPFFVPEGSLLTQNLKNIVLQVVLTQNFAFQGWNWSPRENYIFGVGRPPQTPLGPPRPPQGSGGVKNGCNALVPVQYWQLVTKNWFLEGSIFWLTFSHGMTQKGSL